MQRRYVWEIGWEGVGSENNKVVFSCWQDSFDLAQIVDVVRPSDNRYFASPSQPNSRGLSKIGVVDSDRESNGKKAFFYVDVGMIGSIIGNPNIGTLIFNKSLASVNKLNPKNAERPHRKNSEDNSWNDHPPIWRLPLFGWLLFVIAGAIEVFGLWCAFIFGRYQFYMKRFGWGVACLVLEIFVMVLAIVLMTHGLCLTLYRF
ncbi:MAG: hypothetical protein ABSF92_02850 [Candidatus Acidiferrales bacterium]|jgi:hypothetical protein